MENYKEKVKLLQNEEERYIIEKAKEYQKLLNIENSGNGWNDTTDAFRHVWGSAYLSLKYGSAISNIATSLHELSETYQPKSEREMDEWNNKVGRELANEIKKEFKNVKDEYSWKQIEDLIAQKTIQKIQENKVITLNADSKKNNSPFSKLTDKNYKDELHKTGFSTGFATNLQEDYDFDVFSDDETNYEQPMSFRERLLQSRQEKLARYTQKLAQTPEEIAELESKHVTLDELKAPQAERKQKLRNIIEGKVEFDENADLSSYENKKSGDNKIFTQEEIDEMSEEEREKNKAAIFYQKQTIGIPTREQAEKSAANGGMIHVEAYTRKDGTKVKSYYRSR